MLYKRSDSKLWWCEFIAANGQRVQRSTKTVDKKLAQEFEDKFKVELWRVYQLGERPRYTWKEAVIQWFRESSHLKSMDSIKGHLAFADQYLGDLYLDEIKRPLLD